MFRNFLRLASLPILTAALAGCRGTVELGQVEGTVTAQGVPLDNVLVTFIPDANGAAGSLRSMGMTDAQGRFRLQTEQQQAGAVIGRHRVIVEDLAIYDAPRSEDGTVLQRPVERFPPNLSNPLETPLEVTVNAGTQTVPFEISGRSK